MALLAHQTQGSLALPLRPQLWTKGVKLRYFATFHLVLRSDKLTPWKRCIHLRNRPTVLSNEKPFKVSSFKNSDQSDEADGVDRESKFSKKAVHLSSSSHETEGTLSEPPDVAPHPISYSSEDTEHTTTGSQAIQKLFKKWLVMLRTESLSQATGEFYRESLVQSEISGNQQDMFKQKGGNILKAAFVYFMGLDAIIKIPLLMFVPGYLAARVVYGIEVTNELTPLWILGPLIVTLYIKIIQGIIFLYIFSFKQAIKLIGNIPTYSLLVYNYVAEGKLKACLWSFFCQPVADIINMDYRELFIRKMKQLKEWTVEKYLDYVESIWPYYCRTLRFLKKANLI